MRTPDDGYSCVDVDRQAALHTAVQDPPTVKLWPGRRIGNYFCCHTEMSHSRRRSTHPITVRHPFCFYYGHVASFAKLKILPEHSAVRFGFDAAFHLHVRTPANLDSRRQREPLIQVPCGWGHWSESRRTPSCVRRQTAACPCRRSQLAQPEMEV